ncbi:MAG: nicotinamide riboside transporter PnuC [Ruminococcus sp.]|nr:nicotinamide riboside transporter PnuC [Ruminococcus sp.]
MELKIKSGYFSGFEKILWLVSLSSIIIFFCIFDRRGWLALTASLVGMHSLLLNAKGHPLGQALAVIFSVLYGIISFRSRYYGEMITYLCMTMPMAVFSLVSWLKNPFEEGKAEVAVNRLRRREILFMFCLATAVTVAFYFILNALNTANLIPSTLSITTSFLASYLTFRRSPYYAVAYAFNDIVLVILWTMMTIKNITYLSVTICFIVFLILDIYGFFCWRRMEINQTKSN